MIYTQFSDGLQFSSARLLRDRYGFKGEHRAVGHVIRDQMCYLRRCGVNAFDFGDQDINLEEAVESLDDFTEYFQASHDLPITLLRRRRYYSHGSAVYLNHSLIYCSTRESP